ncbi:patatin-like phospholipase family protein [Vibrio sp. SS-MA-C1-2]|uniref:patatin-like phospholipase family protein n=1 Tax=Vibrio sp. SS-MA-C1-2 TaxID=2908646 RepID=UPI001F476CC4|nr:patatin-like phospholipase family protein [Vibrio sp. SS-MA-C1-2]UJF16866.1 patatin-like phospholipase family protein [Vibrio sp. SS-MA-C1-2]
MKRIKRTVLSLTLYFFCQNTLAEERLKIGVVLSGGGAKGAAHIGVLEVLEKNRIPVDIVTGTSMGAYVGGMAALGLSSNEIKDRTMAINWNRGYQDRAKRNERLLRNKRDEDNYQLHTDIGLSLDGEFKPLTGLVQGQTMAVLLREATHNPPTFTSFSDLPIPYRAVATDIATVKPVVLDHGNLPTAMQASMSVPGALKAVEWEGKLLIDGGIVNNMPVDQAKEMGADIIIAVDLRDSLAEKGDLNSAFSVVNQLTTHMTNAGSNAQKALLDTKKDIYLKPNVSFMTAPEFNKMEQAYQQGVITAEAALPSLLKYQLSEDEYQDYLNHKLDRRSAIINNDRIYIDKIEIVNKSNMSDEALKQMLAIKSETFATKESIEASIQKLYARELFEKITYEIIEDDANQTTIKIDVNEKSWGPGYLNFKLAFEDDLSTRSDYVIGAEYTLTDLTKRGGDWKLEAQLGSWKKVATSFYIPLDYLQTYFFGTGISWSREVRNFNFANDDLDVDLPFDTLGLDDVSYNSGDVYTEFGWNWDMAGELAFGIQGQTGDMKPNFEELKQDFNSYGGYSRFTYDTLNNWYFPASGTSIDFEIGYAHVESKLAGLTSSDATLYYTGQFIKPFSHKKHTLTFKLSGGGSESDEIIPIYVQDLGGLHNLSGYHQYELSGKYSILTGLIYRYQISEYDFGLFSSALYVGASIEQGGVWNQSSEIDFESSLTGGSLYIGADTPLGPLILGAGKAEKSDFSLYLQLGSYL